MIDESLERALRRWRAAAWCLAAGLALAACGGGGGGGDSAPPVVTPPVVPAGPEYLPLAQGNTWVYRRENGTLERGRVTATSTIDGQPGFVVTGNDYGTGEVDTTTYRKSSTALTEMPASGDPVASAIGPLDALRLPLRVGDTYTQLDKTLPSGFDIDGDNRSDSISLRSTVTVLATESVTAPAGTFPESMKVRTQVVQSGVGSATGQPITVTVVSDEWYAPDIGLVRSRTETRTAGGTTVETRELQSYRVGTRSNDSTAPQITARTPAAGGTSSDNVVLVIDFDEALDAAMLDASAVSVLNAGGASAGFGSTSVNGSRLQFTLLSRPSSGPYTVRLNGSIQDLLGNAIAPQQWTLNVDGSGPTLLSTLPAANATQVSLSGTIELRFSKAVNLDTLPSALQIAVVGRLDNVRYTATSPAPGTVRLQPVVALAPDTDYELRFIGPLSDLLGNTSTSFVNVPFRTSSGLFGAPQEVNGYVNEAALAVGDVSGDGRADLVYVPPDIHTLQVRRQRPDGTLEAPYTVALRASGLCAPDSLQIADLNGDGRLDVVVSERDCGLELLLQNAQGVLEAGPFLSSANAFVVRAADLDLDGRTDLVATGISTNTVSIWRQRSDGSFGAETVVPLVHMGGVDMAVGDINGDGRPDIVVSSLGSGPPGKGLGVLLQRADGGFDPGGTLPADPVWGAQGVAIVDIDGDGRQDIVTGNGLSPGLAVYRQGADGRLLPLQVLPGFDGAAYFQSVDVNGDGRRDLVVRQGGLSPIVVMTLQADGTLQRAQQLEALYAPSGPDRLAIGDLNGDGLQDIVMSGPRVMFALPRPASRAAVRALAPQ